MYNIFEENNYLEEALNDKIKPYYKSIELDNMVQYIADFEKSYSDLLQPNIQAIQNATSIFSEYDFQSLLDEFHNTKTLSDLIQPDIQAIQNATSIFSECDFQSLLDEFYNATILSDLFSSEFFSDSLKLNIDKSQDQIGKPAKLLSETSPVLSFKDVDLSELEMFLNTSIKYGNKVLSKDKVSKEIKLQGEEVKQNPKSIHDKIEDLSKKFCLLLIIIRLIMSIPQTIETGEFYKNIAIKVKTSILKEAQYCWVIKEKAYLRETANAKSKVLYRFIYDTKLEIISEIPRWLEVKYVDESGNEYIGWISKISVEKE